MPPVCGEASGTFVAPKSEHSHVLGTTIFIPSQAKVTKNNVTTCLSQLAQVMVDLDEDDGWVDPADLFATGPPLAIVPMEGAAPAEIADDAEPDIDDLLEMVDGLESMLPQNEGIPICYL